MLPEDHIRIVQATWGLFLLLGLMVYRKAKDGNVCHQNDVVISMESKFTFIKIHTNTRQLTPKNELQQFERAHGIEKHQQRSENGREVKAWRWWWQHQQQHHQLPYTKPHHFRNALARLSSVLFNILNKITIDLGIISLLHLIVLCSSLPLQLTAFLLFFSLFLFVQK